MTNVKILLLKRTTASKFHLRSLLELAVSKVVVYRPSSSPVQVDENLNRPTIKASACSGKASNARAPSMKINNLSIAGPLVVLLMALLATGHATPAAEAGQEVAAAGREVQAKVQYCKTCHGLEGQGYRGFFPMPRLAGQQRQYIENQLRAFIERRRMNPVMFNVAHVLSPSMLAALAAHFGNLDPAPIGGAPKDSIATGKTIFEEGLPEANVPACSACHGAKGNGQNEIPRLAGQLFPYTVKELMNWSKERGQSPTKPDTSAIMAPTAHNLTPSQIASVAAYLAYLK